MRWLFELGISPTKPTATILTRARSERGTSGGWRRSAARRLLEASAAAPPHMWKEQGQRRALCAILPWIPWVVVTVPALVPCARMLGWSREVATTSLVTGPVLIPFGRLHALPLLPPPRPSCVCFLLP